jgi:hypothetical protein
MKSLRSYAGWAISCKSFLKNMCSLVDLRFADYQRRLKPDYVSVYAADSQ